MNIAVLGLGAMGLPMATNLAQDLTVRGFDISPARLELAESAGIVAATSARAAASGADIVLLAVRNRAQLDDARPDPAQGPDPPPSHPCDCDRSCAWR